MAYRFRGKMDDGRTFGAKLRGAQNFAVAFQTAGKMLQDSLGGALGKVAKFTLSYVDDKEEGGLTLRTPKVKAAKKSAAK